MDLQRRIKTKTDKRLNDFCRVWRTRAADEAPSKGAAWLMEAGKTDELIRHLRRCRCELVDAMHESRRRVDRMDTLIRQAEKTNV